MSENKTAQLIWNHIKLCISFYSFYSKKIVFNSFSGAGGSNVWIGSNVSPTNFNQNLFDLADYQATLELGNRFEKDVDEQQLRLEEELHLIVISSVNRTYI